MSTKKIFSIMVALGLTFSLAGCSYSEKGDRLIVSDEFIVVHTEDYLAIAKDERTGCHYLYDILENLFVSPYYGKDGKVYGCGKKTKDKEELF